MRRRCLLGRGLALCSGLCRCCTGCRTRMGILAPDRTPRGGRREYRARLAGMVREGGSPWPAGGDCGGGTEVRGHSARGRWRAGLATGFRASGGEHAGTRWSCGMRRWGGGTGVRGGVVRVAMIARIQCTDPMQQGGWTTKVWRESRDRWEDRNRCDIYRDGIE